MRAALLLAFVALAGSFSAAIDREAYSRIRHVDVESACDRDTRVETVACTYNLVGEDHIDPDSLADGKKTRFAGPASRYGLCYQEERDITYIFDTPAMLFSPGERVTLELEHSRLCPGEERRRLQRWGDESPPPPPPMSRREERQEDRGPYECSRFEREEERRDQRRENRGPERCSKGRREDRQDGRGPSWAGERGRRTLGPTSIKKTRIAAILFVVSRTQEQHQDCTDRCPYSGDNECDDGGPGAQFGWCLPGSDCKDCGVRCLNTCVFANNGVCEDGELGSSSALCMAGTDCDDCGGSRSIPPPAIPSPPGAPPSPPSPPRPPHSPDSPRPPMYERTILTVLLGFDGYPHPVSVCDEECVVAANGRLADFMKDQSYSEETFDTANSDVVQASGGSATCSLNAWWNILVQQANTLGVNPNQYTHIEFLLHYDLPCGFGGIGQVGGSISGTLLYWSWEWIRAHELGHNYALLHGFKDGVEYGDYTCIMGNGDIYSGAVRLLRGWVPSNAIASIDSVDLPYEVTVRQIDTDPYEAGSDGQMTLLTAPDAQWGGSWKYVVWLDSISERVTIHKAAQLYSETHFIAALGAGQSFALDEVTLEVLGIDPVADEASLRLAPKGE